MPVTIKVSGFVFSPNVRKDNSIVLILKTRAKQKSKLKKAEEEDEVVGRKLGHHLGCWLQTNLRNFESHNHIIQTPSSSIKN